MSRKYNPIRMALAGAILASLYGCARPRIERPLILPSEINILRDDGLDVLWSLQEGRGYGIASDRNLGRVQQ